MVVFSITIHVRGIHNYIHMKFTNKNIDYMVDISSGYELTISFGLQVANEKGSPCIQSRNIIVCQMICIDLHNKHVEREERERKKNNHKRIINKYRTSLVRADSFSFIY